MNHDLEELKTHVRGYYEKHLAKKSFVPGETLIPVSGKVFDHEELEMLLEASLDCWWTEGRITLDVQQQLAQLFGVQYALLCNSGSSANLLAFTALTSPLLGERRI